jgi:hypothetical protein
VIEECPDPQPTNCKYEHFEGNMEVEWDIITGPPGIAFDSIKRTLASYVRNDRAKRCRLGLTADPEKAKNYSQNQDFDRLIVVYSTKSIKYAQDFMMLVDSECAGENFVSERAVGLPQNAPEYFVYLMIGKKRVRGKIEVTCDYVVSGWPTKMWQTIAKKISALSREDRVKSWKVGITWRPEQRARGYEGTDPNFDSMEVIYQSSTREHVIQLETWATEQYAGHCDKTDRRLRCKNKNKGGGGPTSELADANYLYVVRDLK